MNNTNSQGKYSKCILHYFCEGCFATLLKSHFDMDVLL